MKKLIIGVVIFKALAIGACAVIFIGCAGFYELAKPTLNSEQEALYQRYCQIDPTNLTAEEKKELAEFDQLASQLTDQDLKFIGQFPWINPSHLTRRDKIFLLEIAERAVNAAMSVG